MEARKGLAAPQLIFVNWREMLNLERLEVAARRSYVQAIEGYLAQRASVSFPGSPLGQRRKPKPNRAERFAATVKLDSRDSAGSRTIQELLGHKDVATTMIYTYVLRQGGAGMKSPLDCL